MAAGRVGNMTVDELKALIEAVIEEREMRIDPEAHRQGTGPVEDILASMRKNLIKPQRGQPSTLDLLREDRDR